MINFRYIYKKKSVQTLGETELRSGGVTNTSLWEALQICNTQLMPTNQSLVHIMHQNTFSLYVYINMFKKRAMYNLDTSKKEISHEKIYNLTISSWWFELNLCVVNNIY